MVPDIGEFEIYAGDDWSLTLHLKVKEGEQTLPEDLTGWENWRAAWTGRGKTLNLIVDVTLPNVIVLRAPSATTRLMGAVTGRFDVEATRGGIVRTFFRGTTKNIADVTK